jgi:hypothetical protein
MASSTTRRIGNVQMYMVNSDGADDDAHGEIRFDGRR